MTNSNTLLLLVWLSFWFFLSLLLNQECPEYRSGETLSVSSSIACGPSTWMFLLGTTPISLAIVSSSYQYIRHHDSFWWDSIAFLLAPVACIALFLLAWPFNTYKYPTQHHTCASVFFISVYMHIVYVAVRSYRQTAEMGDKERCVCALAMFGTFVLLALYMSNTKTGCERCLVWFSGAEVAYMALVAIYAYLLKTLVDAKVQENKVVVPKSDVALRKANAYANSSVRF